MKLFHKFKTTKFYSINLDLPNAMLKGFLRRLVIVRLMSIYLLRLKQSLIFLRFMYYILPSFCTGTMYSAKMVENWSTSLPFLKMAAVLFSNSVAQWCTFKISDNFCLFTFSCSLVLNLTKLTLVTVVHWIFFFQPMFLKISYSSINEPLAHDEYFHPFLWNLINF